MKYKFLNMSFFIFTLIPLMGCAKENTNSADQASQASSKGVYQQMVEEQKRNAPAPPIDPSICKNNPQGYIYFKIGDEIFHYNKDSPIYISLVGADSMRAHKKKDTDVPEGCEGNPYLHPGLSIELRHKPEDPEWQKLKLYQFLLYSSEDGKGFRDDGNYSTFLDDFNAIKKSKSNCTEIGKKFERCISLSGDPRSAQPEGYKSDDYLVGGKSFILVCEEYVGGAICRTAYNIYPSIQFSYSFLARENKNFDRKNIILFDQYMKSSFESIRIKN